MIAPLAALALAAAPGCRPALAEVARLDDAALAADALGVVSRLERGGAGGPAFAVSRAARALSDAAEVPERTLADLAAPARALRAALVRHCELAALPTPAFAGAADRAALDEVLARPEFRRARTDPLALRRLLLSAWDWLLERLGSAEAERWASTGRALFLSAAAAATALAVAAWLRRRRRPRPAAAGVAGPEVEAAPPPDRSLALAEAALARGEATAAVRHALLAALGALERAGRVPRGRALTNAELVRAVAARDVALADDLTALARRFDGAVYGARAPTPAEARDAVAGARRLREALA